MLKHFVTKQTNRDPQEGHQNQNEKPEQKKEDERML